MSAVEAAHSSVERACAALARLELDELVELQAPDGGGARFRSPFASALVATALERVGGPRARELRLARCRRLIESREGVGLWHFSRDAFPALPLDADDSACALAALSGLGGDGPAEAERIDFDAALDSLLAHARRDGGCRTWLVRWETEGLPRGANEVDVVVNANVLHFASRIGRRLPSLEAFVADHVEAHGFECARASHYYDSPYAFAYFLARWLARAGRRTPLTILARVPSELAKLVAAAPDHPLELAFALNASLDLRPSFRDAERLARALIDRQQTDGAWPARAFFLGPARTAFGSAGLTTAFCVEALAKHAARFG